MYSLYVHQFYANQIEEIPPHQKAIRSWMFSYEMSMMTLLLPGNLSVSCDIIHRHVDLNSFTPEVQSTLSLAHPAVYQQINGHQSSFTTEVLSQINAGTNLNKIVCVAISLYIINHTTFLPKIGTLINSTKPYRWDCC